MLATIGIRLFMNVTKRYRYLTVARRPRSWYGPYNLTARAAENRFLSPCRSCHGWLGWYPQIAPLLRERDHLQVVGHGYDKIHAKDVPVLGKDLYQPASNQKKPSRIVNITIMARDPIIGETPMLKAMLFRDPNAPYSVHIGQAPFRTCEFWMTLRISYYETGFSLKPRVWLL